MTHLLAAAWACWPLRDGVPAALVWWRADVEWHPFAPCLICKGSGTNRGSRKGSYGLCRHGPRRVRFAARRAAARHLKRRGM